jgi:hypothetical protein
LEDYFEAESTQEVVPTTLTEILGNCGLTAIDYLKTDVEGADFEIIKSCEDFMGHILALKCELRFQPFFEGEPFFHEVADHLNRQEFELIGLKPVDWKPVTAHGKDHRDGRVVFADCLFFKTIDAVRRMPNNESTLAAAKQVIIAVMSEKKCYAEWLLSQYQDILPDLWRSELSHLVTPRPIQGRMLAFTSGLSLLSAGITRRVRKAISSHRGEKVFDDSHVAPRQ